MRRQRRSKRAGSAFEIPDPAVFPERVLAVDPGAALTTRTCGLAEFGLAEGEWVCERAWSAFPRECLLVVRDFLKSRLAGVVVMEEYRLYPDRMADQALTALGVVEVIGAIRWMFLDEGDPGSHGLAMQGASIKHAGERRMTAEGIEFQGRNQHARDAEMHGWFWILAKSHTIGE